MKIVIVLNMQKIRRIVRTTFFQGLISMTYSDRYSEQYSWLDFLNLNGSVIKQYVVWMKESRA